MFDFFKKKKPQSSWPLIGNDSGPTVIDDARMTFDERKAWRESMLRKSIHDAFTASNIIAGMYKYRFLPLDERSHYFVVMVETTKHFAVNKDITTKLLATIEKNLTRIALEEYNIRVEGVYWKANETVEVFENVKEYKIPSNRPKRSIDQIARDFKDTQPNWSDSAYDRRADHVRDTFVVDGKTYDTDISPLGPL